MKKFYHKSHNKVSALLVNALGFIGHSSKVLHWLAGEPLTLLFIGAARNSLRTTYTVIHPLVT
jgi:hypothetical protein